MALTKRLRFEVLRRDNYTCRYCGRSAPAVKLTVDHVHPTALGGNDDPTNLVAACSDCNAGKTSSIPDAPLVANVAEDAIKWARAIQVVAEMRAENRGLLRATLTTFDESWSKWRDPDDNAIPRAPDWPDLVERVLGAGLDMDTLIDFIGITMRRPGVDNSNRWSYFCGCCWRTIDSIQEEAQKVIAFADKWAEDNASR